MMTKLRNDVLLLLSEASAGLSYGFLRLAQWFVDLQVEE